MIWNMKHSRLDATGISYVLSGVLVKLAKVLSSLYVLRYVEPYNLGVWQQFTTFYPYVMILTLGVSNTVSLELPAHIGANEKHLGLQKVSVAGYFIRILSLVVGVLLILVGIMLQYFDILESNATVYWFISVLVVLGTFNNNFLRSTYRSGANFRILSRLQMSLSIYAFLIVPFGFYFGVLGISIHLVLGIIIEFIIMFIKRPYKVKYKWNYKIFSQLVRVGGILYFWNNLNILYRSLPKLSIVLVGDILSLGLYSPLASIYAFSSNISETINTYTFPKMSYLFGKNGTITDVFSKFAGMVGLIFIFLWLISLSSYLIFPLLIQNLLPNFVESINAVKIMVFTGPFVYINLTMHKFIVSIRKFDQFKFLVTSKYVIYGLVYLLLDFQESDALLVNICLNILLAEGIVSLTYLCAIQRLRRSEIV